MLRKISAPERAEITGGWRKLMRNFKTKTNSFVGFCILLRVYPPIL
jgi:hypothetical protein